MKVLAGASALLWSSLLASRAVLASPSPNFELSKTSVHIDRHREALDNGEIIVRVQRTSDLFSDPTASQDARLLLEKDTHIALRIQLDPTAGSVNINDHPLDVASEEPSVAVITADTFTLPTTHDSPVADADLMLSLANEMSPGIVAVEVRVESEPVTPTIQMVTMDITSSEGDDAAKRVPTVEDVSIRKVLLWVRITEVEGQEVPHATTIYSPILQLVVEGSKGKVSKISTLSIDGKPPIESILRKPRPVKGFKLPPLEQAGMPDKGKTSHARPPRPPHHHEGDEERPDHHEVHEHRPSPPHHGKHDGEDGPTLPRPPQPPQPPQAPPRPHHPHHHHGNHKRPGFFAWLMSKIGFSPPPSSSSFHRPCPGMLRKMHEQAVAEAREGLTEYERKRPSHKLETHRVMTENPFSGTFDDDEGYTEIDAEIVADDDKAVGGMVREKYGKHGRPLDHHHHHHYGHHEHHRPHHHHGKCARFFHRLAIGFVYGMATIGTVLMSGYTLFAVGLLCVGTVAVHGLRHFARRNGNGSGGAISLADDDTEAPLLGEKDEKEETTQREQPESLRQVVVDEGSSTPQQEPPMYEAPKY